MMTSDIAGLSTGVYYERPEVWYEQLKLTLAKYECVAGPMPEIHTREGKALISYSGRTEGNIFFTWYQMSSGNWEIICYKS